MLLLGMGRMLRDEGSLEAGFHRALSPTRVTCTARWAPSSPRCGRWTSPRWSGRSGRSAGSDHLLPVPLGPGAAKRLHLYLRWMVRGPDGVDLGIWKRIPTSTLLVPLDTHVARLAWRLGLTRRRTLGWRAAAEVTETSGASTRWTRSASTSCSATTG